MNGWMGVWMNGQRDDRIGQKGELIKEKNQ